MYLTVEQAEARGDGSGEPRDLPTITSDSPTTLTPTSTSSEPSIAVGDGLVAFQSPYGFKLSLVLRV